MTTKLAMLGGSPAFPDGVPFVRPPTPPLARVTELLEPSWNAGLLTNGPLVRRLEEETAEFLGVRHVVGVSSCTTGLMLTLRALASGGDVLVPSFTFSASAHAIAWNGGLPRFVECNRDSFQIDVEDAAARSDGISAILATHVFGAPCDVEAIERLGAEANVPVIFDAAHAFGAQRAVVPVARFGEASVFSMTPTKPLVAGEGGLVATDLDDIAYAVRIGRDYANPGDYDTQFVGLNGRLSEMHAAVALASFERRTENQRGRDVVANEYQKALDGVAGIRCQHIDQDDFSTWKDFTIAVDSERFGINRDALRRVLAREGVDTRCYFDPPVHRQRSYAAIGATLSTTDAVAQSVLSLPMSPDLDLATVRRIAEIVLDVHDNAEELQERAVA